MTLSPCIDCGEPIDGSRCPDCTRTEERAQPDRKSPAASRGYDWTWTKLSRRARRLQPFCTDCGATRDLQTDHSEEAWRRKAAGLPLRLADVDVVCGPCNRARGAQRPSETPPGGIPAGQTLPTPTPESNFASHIVGSGKGALVGRSEVVFRDSDDPVVVHPTDDSVRLDNAVPGSGRVLSEQALIRSDKDEVSLSVSNVGGVLDGLMSSVCELHDVSHVSSVS